MDEQGAVLDAPGAVPSVADSWSPIPDEDFLPPLLLPGLPGADPSLAAPAAPSPKTLDDGAPARAVLEALAREIFPRDQDLPAAPLPRNASQPALFAPGSGSDDDHLVLPVLTPVLRPVPSGGRHGAHSLKGRRKSRFVYPVRRWPRRVLVVANVMVTLTLLMAASAYAYANWRVNQIKRLDLPSLVGGRRTPTPLATIPVAPPGAPMTILVVGSDSRAGDQGSDASQFGTSAQVGGQRSDTIMLIHLVPATRQAAILSIPRDLWVPIPGQGYNRINTAFDTSADLLVQTIESDLNIPIDHFVEVDFQSFRDIVNAVGGVEQYFPTPAKDQFSLLNIPAAGCYDMTGQMALQFVRARHYEYKVNGHWVYEAESDLARIQRQQSFVKKMIAKAESEKITNVGAINGIIGGITTNLTLDSGFSQSLLLSLAERYKNFNPATMPTSTLATYPTVIGGADVLLLQQPDARKAISGFLNPLPPTATTTTTKPASSTTTTIPAVAPSSVEVAVRNGSGRTGEATSTGAALTRQGFQVTSVGSAASYTYGTPEVLYGPGDLAKAQLVASAVEGGVQLQSDPTLQGTDVELITGQSFQGIGTIAGAGTTSPSAPSTTTTAPSTTTTTLYQLPGTPPGSTPPTC